MPWTEFTGSKGAVTPEEKAQQSKELNEMLDSFEAADAIRYQDADAPPQEPL